MSSAMTGSAVAEPAAESVAAAPSPHHGPEISFPLTGDNRVEIRLEKRISAKDFARLKQLLELSEESLVDDTL